MVNRSFTNFEASAAVVLQHYLIEIKKECIFLVHVITIKREEYALLGKVDIFKISHPDVEKCLNITT